MALQAGGPYRAEHTPGASPRRPAPRAPLHANIKRSEGGAPGATSTTALPTGGFKIDFGGFGERAMIKVKRRDVG